MEFPTEADSFFLSPHGKVHYRFLPRPDSPYVCILPGFTMPSSIYVPLAQLLSSRGYSVAVLDYWGRGFTEPRADKNYSLDSHVSLVSLLLRHLGVAKSSFIGVSYGAAVVAGFSSQFPGRVEKLIFLSPLHFTRESPSSLQRMTAGIPYVGAMVLRWAARGMVEQQIGHQLRDREQIIDAVAPMCLQQFTGSWAGADAIARAVGAFSAAEINHAFAGLANVNRKMLVLLGKRDAIANVRECRSWWKRWVQNSHFKRIDGCGHLLHLERTEDIVTRMANFLAL
jgi:pimeloyl-ACP methyl ester carboxylesterase